MTGTGVPREWLWYVWEHVEAPERNLGAPGSVGEPMQKSQTYLTDAWVWIDIHSMDCSRHLRLSGCPQTIDFPQRWIWCMGYCSLSIMNHTSYHLLQYCIYCLATLCYQRNMQVIQTYLQAHWNNNPTKWSKDINQAWCRYHQLPVPFHQGERMQEQKNWSTLQRSWRHSLYLRIIHTGWVAEIEVLYRLPRFGISNKGVMSF